MLQLDLLGPPRITLHAQPLSLPTAKAAALLFYLGRTGTPQPRSALAGLLWGRLPEAAARRNLRVELKRLRDRLDGYVWADRQTISLDPARPLLVDAHLLHQITPDKLPETLEMGVALWRGDFLDGFSLRDAPEFELWQLAEREQLRAHQLQLLTTLSDHYQAALQPQRALPLAQQRLALDPLREAAHRSLMHILLELGDRAAALAQYERCVELLALELGIEPSDATQALAAAIQTPSSLPQAARSASLPPPHNLPAQTSSFIGREEELTQLEHRLMQPACRLVTLLGSGGSGKTRLALAAGRHLLPHFSDGVFFVPLAGESLNGAATLLTPLAAALGIPLSDEQEAEAQLLDALAERACLLILDNFEHLLPAADWLPVLLQRTSHLRLLVTSRSQLNLYEEWLFDVGGLEIDGVESSGQQLFIARAQRVSLNFDAAQNAEAIATICRQVEGLPLGIELAAYWVRHRSCPSIAEALAENVDLLATSLRNVPERQRTMRAVFDYSWGLCAPDEQQLLAQISVFRGGFTEEAAVTVCRCDGQLLTQLVEKSLLRREVNGRYDLHELIRQLAAEQLGADPTQERRLQANHSHYFANFLNGRFAAYQKGDPETLAETSLEANNIESAWLWALQNEQYGDLTLAIRGLGYFYDMRSWMYAGKRLYDQAVAIVARYQPEPHMHLFHKTLLAGLYLGQANFTNADFPAAIASLERAIAAFQEVGVKTGVCLGLYQMGQVQTVMGDYSGAVTAQQASLDLARELGEEHSITRATQGLITSLRHLGRISESRTKIRECIELFSKSGDVRGLGYVYTYLTFQHYKFDGDIKAAAATLEEARRLMEQVPSAKLRATVFVLEGILLREKGELAAAEAALRQCEGLEEKVLRQQVMVALHNQWALLAVARSELEEAQQWVEQASKRARQDANPGYLSSSLLVRIQVAEAREERPLALAALREGLQLTLDHNLVTLGLEFCFWGAELLPPLRRQVASLLHSHEATPYSARLRLADWGFKAQDGDSLPNWRQVASQLLEVLISTAE